MTSFLHFLLLFLDIVKVRHAVAVPENYTANARQIRFESSARLQYGMQARLRLAIMP